MESRGGVPIQRGSGNPSAPGTGVAQYQLKEITPMMTQFNVLATYLRARFGDTERGASLVEYALLVALIAVVAIVGITFLGKSANDKLSGAGSSIAG